MAVVAHDATAPEIAYSTLRFSIRHTGVGGWELTEDRDETRVRTVRCTDWHRVERAAALIDLEVAGLEREGWTIRAALHGSTNR